VPTIYAAGSSSVYQWFKERLILSLYEPTISQKSQFKEDTVKPARDFNLKAYATINLTQVIRWDWVLNPGPYGHRSQAVRTVTLPSALPGQALWHCGNARYTENYHQMYWATRTTWFHIHRNAWFWRKCRKLHSTEFWKVIKHQGVYFFETQCAFFSFCIANF